MQTLHAGQVTPSDLPPLSHAPPGMRVNGDDPHRTSHLLRWKATVPWLPSLFPAWPPRSHTTHETEAVVHLSFTPFVSRWDAQSSYPGSAQGEQIFLRLLIHLLLLPAVICILEFTALNIVVKILTPQTQNLTFCCHKWYS